MSPKQLLWSAVVAALIATILADDDTAKIGETRNQLQSAEAGGGKAQSTAEDSEERKTLSQQVADGKYGLIQRELFSSGHSSAPGVISYDPNPEVPKDTSDNLGGLAREEIWLAEDHLLVLRGGKFAPEDSATPYSAPVSPIDDYRAPARQVKIPSKPKIPPPFPVQLTEDGPLQIIAAPPQNHQETPASKNPSYGANKTNPPSRKATNSNASRPAKVPPQGAENSEGAGKGEGAPALAPPPLDEDDPSIYYPPPYSFFYPRDNTTIVPPGPLVPGIVLPPPPNFFGKLLPPTRPTTTPRPTTTTPRTTTTTPWTTTRLKTTSKPPPTKTTTTKLYLPPLTTTPEPTIITQAPRPVYFEYYERNKPQPEVIRPPKPLRTYVSSTAIPLRAYYKTPSRPAQFYFYEEDPTINEVNTPRTPPRYYIATVARPQPQQKQPSFTVDNFNHHIQQLKDQLRMQQRQQRFRQDTQYQQAGQYHSNAQYRPNNQYRVQNEYKPNEYRQPRPVYQYSFGYEDRIEPTPQPPTQYNLQIQPSVEYNQAIQEQNTQPPEYSRPIQQHITPNPINHAYYTKQDESYFDDRTKKYFTVFGQKITSPLPPILRNDINVNYRRPLPPHNPQAEYLPEANNYQQQTGSSNGESGGPGTFISYRLPGNGAHFYFLTPQLAAQQQSRHRSDEDSSGNGYFYDPPARI